MPIAIIDLGSNTFKLLIAELSKDKKIKVLHQSIYSSRLAKDATISHSITTGSINSALESIDKIMSITKEFGIVKPYFYATSIIRSTINGELFVADIECKFNVKVEIIDGDREAELIYKGTQHALDMNHEKIAILDIGGGSCEIIIADANGIFWKQSFDIGIRRIIEKFNPSYPIEKKEVIAIQEYIRTSLKDLTDISDINSIKTLVGTAGIFDSLRKSVPIESNTEYSCEIKLKDYFAFHQGILKSDLEHIKSMPDMIDARAELLVVASIFIKEILSTLDIRKMYQSSFSLKEGAFFELTEK